MGIKVVNISELPLPLKQGTFERELGQWREVNRGAWG